MGAARQRVVVGFDSRPSLPRHVRLHFDHVRQGWALLSPERIFWPDETSLEILRRCDGTTSVKAMAAALAVEYDAEEGEVAADVMAFLQEWADQLLVRLQ
jgi:pyrroloquinoline quinone biosynthesis protein D